jgi:hypothetical protein
MVCTGAMSSRDRYEFMESLRRLGKGRVETPCTP